jgi:hypothetical protein
MKCPHCLVEFHADQTWWSVFIGQDADTYWLVSRRTCPACRRFVLELENGAGFLPGTVVPRQNSEGI